MKKITYLLLAFVVLSSCKQEKIGFIDNGKVINAYQEKIDVESKYEAKNSLFQKRIDSISKVLQAESQDFQSKAKTMSQENAQNLYQQLAARQQRLSNEIQQEQQEMQEAFQTEIDTLISKVKKFVKDYGKQNGYTYIFGTSEASSSVMYGTPENDLSQEIIDALNSAYEQK
ncbi:MAG TPA: OmpH family outer membrane protein [Flavobacteriaceae bacterium]|nr:OmpH family outer membrane protein [Flavobacteriaceae bacterium]